MRPRIVILTLLLAAGVLALLGVLHGSRSKPEVQPPPPPGGVPPEVTMTNVPEATSPAANLATTNLAVTNIVATISDEDRAAQKAKDLEAISDALIAGADDPRSALEIANRFENADAEVRAAARDASMHLGDTNILRYLNNALGNTQDPREKAALMDAIAYLQLASQPAETMTNERDPSIDALLASPAPRTRPPRTNAGIRSKPVAPATPAAPGTAPQEPP